MHALSFRPDPDAPVSYYRTGATAMLRRQPRPYLGDVEAGYRVREGELYMKAPTAQELVATLKPFAKPVLIGLSILAIAKVASSALTSRDCSNRS